MIPRYQKIVFVVLLVVSIVMGTILVRLREQAHDRLLKGEDLAPTVAPAVAPAEQATLVVANDSDGTLVEEAQSLPLPRDAEARARALLDKLLEMYAGAGSLHPVPGAPKAVLQVFLLPVARASEAKLPNGGQLAVVDLAGAFADGHPSGILTESLTVESICGTLRANLPQITEVRFLVDGQPRATLAGHADLTRTYLTADSLASAGTTSNPVPQP
ncbi:GerMN domain-containing protein [Acidicapsa acidisoli]|uniref:GerMN domain-containing protein n=1 Tax=Acidicapsa acidisoli TaxID=1615681 RepID=UPI0021E0DC8E|nr:GerMN domain-containing protein [Acidicapsa acidisoli]